ncbi:MAG: hypothetical protein FWG79_02020 [Bacteroidales bacterium]|nr:hypothetical protein [Bacteroidales bacterium]
MKLLKKILCYTLSPVGIVLGLILLISAWFYATSPIYKFEEPKPFSGKNFYNPYQHMDKGEWKKCVFHLHTKSWMGLIEDGKDTPEDVLDVYKKLHFDVVGISHHHIKINKTDANNPFYIPIYEHGIGVKQVHNLALGAQGLVWRDYMFSKNLSQKQHLIDLLKTKSRYVAIAHPARRRGYSLEDFKYLSGYDLFELQSGGIKSEKQWDVALSSGHRAWLVANDDGHSITNLGRVQREVTFVNILESTGDAILESLVQGKAFGVSFPRVDQPTFELKKQASSMVSFPVSVRISEDSLLVQWGQTMEQIEFIGDSGKLLKTVTDSDFAYYLITPEDTYVRVKLHCSEGFVYYLNPIVRSLSGDMPALQLLSNVDRWKTVGKRTLLGGCFVALVVCIIKFRQRKKFQKNN